MNKEKYEIFCKMSDKDLYNLCREYGKTALSAKRKFAGLLPEVLRRKLYEKKGFSSIFEFAAKLAGMSRDQVQLVINLEKKFENKPLLKKALVSGEISVNKLTRVASIATAENQEELVEKVKIFSNRAIETFVKDVKRTTATNEIKTSNSFLQPLFDNESLHVQTLKLDKDIEEELLEMQEKGIDINQFLRNALKKRRENIEIEKTEIAKEQNSNKENTSRYIPAKIKRTIKEEHGTKCSYPGCSKGATTLHHTQRFALTQSHNPQFIAPLCEAHHEIAHKIDIKFAEKSANL